VDPLAQRIADRQAKAAAHAAALRERVPALVRILHDRGAQRVWLTGSLAKGAVPYADSDIDLCVEGLSESAVWSLQPLLEQEARCPVDVLRWEGLSEAWKQFHSEFGIEVCPVPG
jgi:predicted nucleotidyltransferase